MSGHEFDEGSDVDNYETEQVWRDRQADRAEECERDDESLAWSADFLARVRARLAKGEAEYGDASHARATGELLREIQEELEDVAGWSAILWARLERIRKG